MFKIFMCCSLLFTSIVMGQTSSVGILKLDTQAQPALVYATDGRVYEADLDDSALIDSLKLAEQTKVEVDLELTEFEPLKESLNLRRQVLNVTLLNFEIDFSKVKSVQNSSLVKEDITPAELQNEKITNFSSIEHANRFFKTQRRDTKWRSQCYNRAHVWAWELNKKSVVTGKMWIFFSRKYIRRYGFKWWFHISPYVKANGEIKIMDRSFIKNPLSPNDWVDQLVEKKIKCKEVYKYTDYSENQDSANCFFIKTSRYYWQPFQIENAEKKGEQRFGWNDWELKRAYKNAIGYFSKVP